MEQTYGTLDSFATIDTADPARVREHAVILELRAQAPEQVAIRDTYLDLLGIEQGQRVLEVGCGSGPVTRAVARRVGAWGRAVGLDPSAVFLDAARETAAREGLGDVVELHVGDGRALPFADAAFDVVLAVTTLHHVPDAERAVREMIRVTRPGGRVGVFENDSDSAIIAHPDRDLTRRIVAAFSDQSFTNSWLARRLPGLLTASGVDAVEVRAFTALERDPAGWFAHLTEFRAVAATQVAAITEVERDEWLATLRGEQAAGRFLAGQTSLFVWGTRPGG